MPQHIRSSILDPRMQALLRMKQRSAAVEPMPPVEPMQAPIERRYMPPWATSQTEMPFPQYENEPFVPPQMRQQPGGLAGILETLARGLTLPGGGYQEEFERNRQVQEDALRKYQLMQQLKQQRFSNELQLRGQTMGSIDAAKQRMLEKERLGISQEDLALRQATGAREAEEFAIKKPYMARDAESVIAARIASAEQAYASAENLRESAKYAGDEIAIKRATLASKKAEIELDREKFALAKEKFYQLEKPNAETDRMLNQARAAVETAKLKRGGIIDAETMADVYSSLQLSGWRPEDIVRYLKPFADAGIIPALPDPSRLQPKGVLERKIPGWNPAWSGVAPAPSTNKDVAPSTNTEQHFDKNGVRVR